MGTSNQRSFLRTSLDLNQGWTFIKEKASPEWMGGWQAPADDGVDFPHCWNTRDTHPESKAYYRGYGSYRRSLCMPGLPSAVSTDVLWRLESEGFYGVGDVWVDGHRIAAIEGQYLGFTVDLTSHVVSGREHRIGIRLTNHCPKHVLPGINMPDFILHGGLAGRLFLRSVPRQHLDESQLQVQATIEGVNRGALSIGTLAVNAGTKACRFKVEWSIHDREGHVLARVMSSDQTCAPLTDCCLESGRISLEGITHWSIETPALYRVEAVLHVNDLPHDRIACRFGFRHAEFRPDKGFFLNGRSVELRGCNRHEYWPGYGNALPFSFHADDARRMKDMGMNFVRLSHYPQHPAFLDACDECGLLVYAEIATWKSVSSSSRWIAAAVRQMAGMVVRDRNHPSVILWGMGNESRSRKAFLRLREVVKTLDPDRPVIYAENHWRRAKRQQTLDVCDVWGANYELDQLENGRKASFLKSVVVSECANYPHARRGDFAAEMRQIAILERDMDQLGNKPYVAGFALWCLTDYPTLRKKRYIRYSGLLDTSRIPKMAAAWFESRFSEKPYVALYGDWFHDTAVGVKREIHLFTNCDRTRLMCQGRELAAYEGPQSVKCTLDFIPDILSAIGDKAGHSSEAHLVPHERAVCVALSVEGDSNSFSPSLPIAIHIEVRDQAGQRVRNWNGDVTIEVQGPVRTYLTRFCDSIYVADGCARFWIAGYGYPGFFHVKAHGSGLFPGEARGTMVGQQATITTCEERWTLSKSTKRLCPWRHCHAAHILLGDLSVPKSFGWSRHETPQGPEIVLNREYIHGNALVSTIVTPEMADAVAGILATAHGRKILTGAVRPADWVSTDGQVMLVNLTKANVLQHYNPWALWRMRKEILLIRDGWLCKNSVACARFNKAYSQASTFSKLMRVILGVYS